MCSLEEKERLLESGEPAYYTTPHYDGYGSIIVICRRSIATPCASSLSVVADQSDAEARGAVRAHRNEATHGREPETKALITPAERHVASSPGVWFVFYKAHTGVKSFPTRVHRQSAEGGFIRLNDPETRERRTRESIRLLAAGKKLG